MIDLSVIIVNFNNDRVLKGCLPSLVPALAGIDAEVLLSDNGSTDGSLAWVREEFPDVDILENGANLGFAEANNRAFDIARGRTILLLNPDTIMGQYSLRPMLDFLESHLRVGAVGCKLRNPDGSRQISARAFPSLLTYWLSSSGLAWRYPRSRFCGRFNMTYRDEDVAAPVDWVSGAAILFRREILARVGYLDPYFFLTYDEVDFCHRIKDAGYEVWYVPEAEIVHLDRQSEPQSNPNPEARIKYLTVERNSRVRYFVKHHGVAYAALIELFHLMTAAAFLVKAKLRGTKQSPISIMEKGLLLRLYWRTVLRIPRACWESLVGRGSFKDTPKKPWFFVNPYTTDGF